MFLLKQEELPILILMRINPTLLLTNKKRTISRKLSAYLFKIPLDLLFI